MDTGTLGRVILLLLTTWTVLHHLRNWHYSTNIVSRAAGRWIIIAIGLLIVSVVAAIPRPTTLFLRSVTVAAFLQSALLQYFAFDQLIRSEVQRFYTTKVYIGMSVLLVLNIVLEYLRRDNLGSFIDNEVYYPNIIYFASYGLFHVLWLILGVMIVIALKRFIQRNTELPYRLRGGAAMIGWLIGCLCAILVGINLGLSVIIGDIYRAHINEIYHILKIPMGLMILISAAPAPLFMTLSRPVEGWRVRQQAQHKDLIHDLHATMIRVVPLVHLSNEAFRDIRAPIEISDARDVLWSHYPRTQPITARDEARLLRTLLRENVTLTTIGQHQPQETRDPLTIHNLKVAKLLKRDEQPL